MMRQACTVLTLSLLAAAASGDEPEGSLTLDVAANLKDEAEFRDVWTFQFEGNSQFSDDQLRRSLMNDNEVQGLVWPLDRDESPSWPADTREQFIRTVADRLRAAYRYAAYCDVKVSPVDSSGTKPLRFQIDEGPRFVATVPKITGADENLRGELLRALTETSGHKIADVHYESPWWRPGAPAPYATNVTNAIEGYIKQTLERDGYDFAEVRVWLTLDSATHSSTLNVDVTPGRRILTDVIKVRGNRNYSQDQVLSLASISTGCPSGRNTCDAIEERLHQTGRFLSVHAWTDAPFDENDDVALQIDVLEYEGLGPADRFSELQEAVVAFGQWLNDWPSNGDDLTFRGVIETGPNVLTGTTDVRELLKTDAKSASSKELDPVEEAIRQMLPTSLLPEGQLEFDFVLSPAEGCLIKAILKPDDGKDVEVLALRTQEYEGIVFPQSGTCWVQHLDNRAALPSRMLELHLDGGSFGLQLNMVAPDQAELSGVAIQSEQDTSAKSDNHSLVKVSVVPGSLLKVCESAFDSFGAGAITTTNDSLSFDAERSQLKLGPAAGELISAQYTHKTFTITVVPAPGRLKTETDSLLALMASCRNHFNPEAVKSSLAQFMAAELRPVYSNTQMPLHEFAARVLAKPDVADAVADAMEKLQRVSFGETPQYVSPAADPGLLGLLRLGQVLISPSSPTHRWLAAREAAECQMAATPIYARFMDVMTNESAGPVDMLVAAAMYGKSIPDGHPQGVASLLHFGGRRLAKDRFSSNVKLLLSQDAPAGKILFGTIEVVQDLPDADFDRLMQSVEVRPDNLSSAAIVMHFLEVPHLLSAIRGRTMLTPAETLDAVLSDLWDSKLAEKLPALFQLNASGSGKPGQFIFSGQKKEQESEGGKSDRDEFLERLGPLEFPDL